jgi:hypothetical protein
MPPESKSLIEIFRDVGQNCYRVRNTISLDDFLVTNIENPEWVTATNLDSCVCNVMNATQKRYILLSDADELALFTKSNKDNILQRLLVQYRKWRD